MAVSALSTLTNVVASSNTTTSSSSSLNGDDFMKLLLTQLQQQDPTNPMDIDKMMTQTTQLSQLQSSMAAQTAMEEMTKSFQQYAGYGIASMVGHLADSGDNSIALTKGSTSTVQAYFPSDADSGAIVIKDASGNTVKTFDLTSIKEGTYYASWDGTNSAGTKLDSGTYYSYISYSTSSGATQTASTGTFPISGVKMASGTTEAQVLLGNKYVAVSKLKTIY